jgi:hypothetical protein
MRYFRHRRDQERRDQERRDQELARNIKAKLRELLDLQAKSTVVELTLDGSAIHASLRELKARARRKPDPTPSLARRARTRRRGR